MPQDATCSVDGCTKTTGRFVAGMCSAHYQAKRKYGDPRMTATKLRRLNAPKVCVADRCERAVEVLAEGLCKMHYAKLRAHGDYNYERPRREGCMRDGCDQPHYQIGWCRLHHWRVINNGGDPGPVLSIRQRAIADRILPKLEKGERSWGGVPCLEWTGSKSAMGYGSIRYKGKTIQIHRWMHEQHNGPIPEGYQVDHLCMNPPCAEPAHLEAVTGAENTRRYWEAVETGRVPPPQRGTGFCCCGRHRNSPRALDALAYLGL